ncbi:type IV secretion protein Rhs [Mucilaginibacter sp. 21P]|uniref:type VI secretion system Vgr family protein n=1 Tax=Mucilaginibacter sp. 21P TaxID=2778902 RepID=UPI001C591FD6|nr:phage baseplate assembly protein V [Mucilaginibacter sp. 21P]QXV65580.1 type IV secretion protein Rhs [Mucilaginibacter sp. 21P]
METKIKVDISIEGTPITHFSSFNLEQRFNEHQSFQLRFNHDQVENSNKITLEKSKDFIGKNLTVQFGRGENTEHQFTGKITRVEIAQSHGFQGDIVISGYSPTILIDRGPDLGSYLNKDLKTIVQKATEDAPQNDLNLNISPAYTSPIDYIIQYRESDFDFINRLSAEYHEWFYYDGVKLNFGKPSKLDEVPLIYGRDLHSLQYGLQIAPLKYQKFAYHSLEDKVLSSKPSESSGSNPDLSHVISASNQVYSKQYNEPIDVRVSNQKEIDTFVNDEHKAIVSELLNIMGNGDNPQVKLGCVVNISTSMRADTGFQVQDFGKFLVTAVYHQLDGVGHYQNTFEGVSADSEKLPVRHAEKPLADMQLAMVLDNNDPKKQGRIKVQFKWQCTSNDPTEWLRVMSPNAGHGDTGKNRGFLVVPEVGDQVVVAFEEGNIARPIIMGSVYHSNNVDSGGFSNSNIKGMTSRRGSHLQFDDAAHALSLATSLANMIHVDEPAGSLTGSAANTVTLQSAAPANGAAADNSLIISSQKGSVDIVAKETVSITTGKSSIKLYKDGKIELTGLNIIITGTESVQINGGTITAKADKEQKLVGKPVNIN